MPQLNLNIWHYVALIAIAALLMGLGGVIDHRMYAYPAIQALNQQKGANVQATTDAKQSAVKTEGTQNAQTQASLAYWKTQALALGRALSRMRQQPTTYEQYLPSPSVSASAVHETIGEYSGIGTGKSIRPCLGGYTDPCSVSQDFYENALDDADLINNGWQDWAKRQHIPVQ